MKAAYFASAAKFRHWLKIHHATTTEFLVGFYKVNSGKGGLTYSEAVDELLCYGWIDGVKRRVDDLSYTHRITPRKPDSTWSNINVGHVARLTQARRMQPAGVAAFMARNESRTGIYSYERQSAVRLPQKFPPALERVFRARKRAWRHWQGLPPGYQRTIIAWVTSAKQQATRQNRLKRLIDVSAQGRRL